MKVKPILMNEYMVKALLDGRKTNTRRIIKPQPFARIYQCDETGNWFQWWDYGSEPCGAPSQEKEELLACPYGEVGDLLYVRENWILNSSGDCGCEVIYEADGSTKELPPQYHNGIWKNIGSKPSIHMPREISRLTLEITNIHVERLQEISEEDAKSEGILIAPPLPQYLESVGDIYSSGVGDLDDPGAWTRNPVFAFCHLWESINGKDSWEANSWVWAISFKVHEYNVDDFIKIKC